jgi:hypothetical protein
MLTGAFAMNQDNPSNELKLYRQDYDRELPKLPAEVGLLIMGVGVVGLLLPGPIGTPLIVSGGLSLWPRAFRPADRWMRRNCPKTHASGSNWLLRFKADLERRYPSGPIIARIDPQTNGHCKIVSYR